MIKSQFTRRRVLSIFAASASALLIGAKKSERLAEWRGTALAADARIILDGISSSEARNAIEACVAEIERLENIFSMYREQSEICRLNAHSELGTASLDMRILLRLCQKMHKATAGLFDPTVQKLWRTLAQWSKQNPEHKAPPKDIVQPLIATIGMDKLSIHDATIRLAPGSEITLNGIAQGYITDRVAALLRRRGFSHTLLDLGEVYALDGRRDGTPWQVKIRETGLVLPAKNIALATSAGSGLVLAGNNLTHLLNPATGQSPQHWQALSVEHTSAAVADALSTGLYAASPKSLHRIISRLPNAHVWATDFSGQTKTFSHKS